jgi:CBS domain-containing protein
MEARETTEMLIKDRPELPSKPEPLAMGPDALASEAVAAMCERNYGSVIVVDEDRRPVGIVTERDVMRKLVDARRDPEATPLSEIMTRDVRVAQETDAVLDWLRIMSNDRFRRLPVVDQDGRIKAVMTQGDFVSYTWPELIYQGRQIVKATLSRNFHYALVAGGILLYTIIMVIVLQAL